MKFNFTACVITYDEETLRMGRIFNKPFMLLAVRWLLLAITIQSVSSRAIEESRYSQNIESTQIFDDAVSVTNIIYIF